jgi:4-hydroxy-3-methylbut-2-enyl diphosphate reductase
MRIILAKPRGFCAGVDRAIEIVERALQQYGSPVYVRHEIVHNKYVVDSLGKKGAIFVEEVDEIPLGQIVIFSAHGVAESVEKLAADRDLRIIDATCPLVTRVHRQAQRAEAEDRQIILIGHAGHPEVEGTSGRVEHGVLLVSNVNDVGKLEVDDPDKLFYVTQTTLSVNDTLDILDALTEKYPNIKGPGIKDICYATQNRQEAVKELSKRVDLLLVVGAYYSSNSVRLRDFGEDMGTPSYLIASADQIDETWLNGVSTIGLTAGASAPEVLVEGVIDFIRERFPDTTVETMEGKTERVKFELPVEVRG